MVKVVYEAALFRGVGGGPVHYVGLANGLRQSGHQVLHVFPRKAAVSGDDLGGNRITLVAPGNRLVRQATYEISRALLILWFLVRRRRFDVWVARQSVGGVVLLLARLVADNVVLEVNGPMREEILDNFGSRLLAQLADRTFRWQITAANTVIAVTPGLANYTRKRSSRTQVEVLPNGADGLDGGVPWVDRETELLFAGALTPWYELETCIRALGILRDAGQSPRMEVLGEGSRRQELQELAEGTGVGDMVTFRGWVSPDEVQAALRRSKVGLLPLKSKNHQIDSVGSPLKLYEYAAAGLAVVGTAIDGVVNSPVKRIVHFYSQEDVMACATAINSALEAGSPDLDSTSFSWTTRGQRLIEIATGV